jgi:hypothetical protein
LICFLACFLAIFLTFFLLIAELSTSEPATAVPASAARSASAATRIAGDGPERTMRLIISTSLISLNA